MAAIKYIPNWPIRIIVLSQTFVIGLCLRGGKGMQSFSFSLFVFFFLLRVVYFSVVFCWRYIYICITIIIIILSVNSKVCIVLGWMNRLWRAGAVGHAVSCEVWSSARRQLLAQQPGVLEQGDSKCSEVAVDWVWSVIAWLVWWMDSKIGRGGEWNEQGCDPLSGLGGRGKRVNHLLFFVEEVEVVKEAEVRTT